MSKQSTITTQNQQKKHKMRPSNRPKVSNTDARAISLTLLCCHNSVPISHPATATHFDSKQAHAGIAGIS